MELTPEEQALAARIGFDEDVLRLVKQGTGEAELCHYRSYERGRLTKRSEPPWEGFSVSLPVDVEPLVLNLRPALLSRGYLPFVSERHRPSLGRPEPGCLVVLKTRDQFDIVRAGYTEGNNDCVENNTIVIQSQDWDRRYGLTIIGANGDWVEMQFKVTPADVAEVGREAIALCPDLQAAYWDLAEEQTHKYYPFRDGDEDIENQLKYALGRDIARYSRLFLWWD